MGTVASSLPADGEYLNQLGRDHARRTPVDRHGEVVEHEIGHRTPVVCDHLDVHAKQIDRRLEDWLLRNLARLGQDGALDPDREQDDQQALHSGATGDHTP